MANQYKNALYYAAQALSTELNRWGVTVDPGERMIVWNDVTKGIPPGTTKLECIITLKKFIKASQNSRQVRLL